jgi:hypothetical protein
MRERGQGSVEWIALLCVVAGAVAALGAVVAHTFAATLGRSNRPLVSFSRPTDRDAAVAQRWAPRIVFESGMRDHPVDPRTCRARACAEGHGPAVLLTHVIHRERATYVQYWAYWPDSSWHGIAGRHADDWESFQVRINPDGTADARASAHHGYTGRRIGPDLNVNQVHPEWVPQRWRVAWIPWQGGYRVAKNSHAGFVTSAAGGVAPVLIALDPAQLPQDYAVTPPWRKAVYADPESAGT